jgi:hypothetical protein
MKRERGRKRREFGRKAPFYASNVIGLRENKELFHRKNVHQLRDLTGDSYGKAFCITTDRRRRGIRGLVEIGRNVNGKIL